MNVVVAVVPRCAGGAVVAVVVVYMGEVVVASWWFGEWEDEGERKGLLHDEILLGVRGFFFYFNR